MSSNYSANQYESSFRSISCCKTKAFKQRATGNTGKTTFIANNHGHLLPGVTKRGNAWPDFKGTWDLPARIPVHHINPTGRSVEGLKRLRSRGLDPNHKGTSETRPGKDKLQNLQDNPKQDHATQTSTARAHSSWRQTRVGSTTNQRPDSQEPVDQSSDKDKQPALALENETLLSSGSMAEEKSGGDLKSRPQRGRQRSASKSSTPSILKKT